MSKFIEIALMFAICLWRRFRYSVVWIMPIIGRLFLCTAYTDKFNCFKGPKNSKKLFFNPPYIDNIIRFLACIDLITSWSRNLLYQEESEPLVVLESTYLDILAINRQTHSHSFFKIPQKIIWQIFPSTSTPQTNGF